MRTSKQVRPSKKGTQLLASAACVGAALLLMLPTSAVSRSNNATPVPVAPLQASQPAACAGVLADSGRLVQVLPTVPKYHGTYVLVISQRVSSRVTSPTSAALKDIEVGVDQGTPAVDAARSMGLTKLKMYTYDSSNPAQPLADMNSGSLDAAILWAPLAGAGLLDLNMDDKVSVFSVDRPLEPPSTFSATSNQAADACGAAIADDLDADGVLPAELLVSVNIRSLLGQHPVPEDMQIARKGEVAFQQICARCHGDKAVANKVALAPVDLLQSIRRFQFVGFKYIVLNGRPQKSMPPLRGTVSEEQIAQIYQYLRARSKGLLLASD